MIDVPEITVVDTRRVSCDGAGAIRGGAGFRPAALGHPRVWLEIDEKGYIDRRFVLAGNAAEHGIHEISPGDLPPSAEGSAP